MTRSRISSKRSGKLSIGSAYPGYQDNLIIPQKKAQQTISLPIVTGASTKVDTSFNVDDKEYREPTPEGQRSGSDVVIVQLFTERYYNMQRESNNNLLEPQRSSGVRTPTQQRMKSQRKNPKPPMENLLEVSSTRTVTQHVVETRDKLRPDVSSLSGFTQTELKMHTDREKQKSTVYLLNEQEKSKRIVENWLRTLPNKN